MTTSGVLKILDPASNSWVRIGGQGATGPTGPSGGPTGATGPTGPAGPPTSTGTAHQPAGSATVYATGASGPFVAAYTNRKQIWVYNNDSVQVVYLTLGSTGATTGAGIRVNPNGGYWTSTFYNGPICGVCTSTGGGTSASVIYVEI